MRSAEDFRGVISVETYQLCELLTYSEATLSLLYSHILELERAGCSLAEQILLNEVRYYGYDDLEHAEAAAGGDERRA